MAGIPISNLELQNRAGTVSLNVQKACNDAEEFKRFLDSYSAQQLSDEFLIPLEDANLIKSAYGELDIVVQAQIANRTFSSRLTGMGDTAV